MAHPLIFGIPDHHGNDGAVFLASYNKPIYQDTAHIIKVETNSHERQGASVAMNKQHTLISRPNYPSSGNTAILEYYLPNPSLNSWTYIGLLPLPPKSVFKF